MRVTCPGCAVLYDVPNEALGKTVQCSSCQTQFLVDLPREELSSGAAELLKRTAVKQGQLFQLEDDPPAPRPKQNHCVSCGRKLGMEIQCGRCGWLCCSERCLEEHRDFAHGVRRKTEREPDRQEGSALFGVAIAGFVMGCVAITVIWFPCGMLTALPVSLIGMLLCLGSAGRGRGFAAAGAILNGLVLALVMVWWQAVTAAFSTFLGR